MLQRTAQTASYARDLSSDQRVGGSSPSERANISMHLFHAAQLDLNPLTALDKLTKRY